MSSPAPERITDPTDLPSPINFDQLVPGACRRVIGYDGNTYELRATDDYGPGNHAAELASVSGPDASKFLALLDIVPFQMSMRRNDAGIFVLRLLSSYPTINVEVREVS